MNDIYYLFLAFNVPSVEHLAYPIVITVRIPNAVAQRNIGPRLFDFDGFSINKNNSGGTLGQLIP